MTRDEFFALSTERRKYLINRLHSYYDRGGKFGEDASVIVEEDVREFFLMQKELTHQYDLEHPVVY